MKGSLFVLGATLGLASSVLGQTCDVTKYKTNAVTYESFSADDLKLVQPAKLTSAGSIQLTEQELNGGVVGYAWLKEKQRVADGFLATYTYKFSGEADGFGFVVQNDAITNLNSGVGSNLGFDGIRASVAVGLDMCPNRPADCDGQQPEVVVVSRNATGTIISVSRETVVEGTIDDGESHKVEVMYSQFAGVAPNFGTVKVSVDGKLVIDAYVGQLEDIFSSRYAYVGFTGSTLYEDNQSADQIIESLILDKLPSNTIVELPETEPVMVEYNNTVDLNVIFRDSCLKQLSVTPDAQIEAFLTEQVADVKPEVLYPSMKDNEDGTVTLTFGTPNFLKAKWDLTVVVDGVPAEGSPYTSAVQTIQPTFTIAGFPIEIFVLLLILLFFLLILIAVVVRYLRQYRQKLKDNDEFIKAGQQQAELQKLEDGVTFSNNPMMGSIEDLKAQLERNQAELAQLRNRDFGEDDEHTVDQLEKQRDELLAEMNRLKREEQEEQAKAQTFTGANTGGLGRKRVEFNPMQTNE